MVLKRRLQVDRQAAVVPGLSTALDQLLSRHVLTEWQPSPTATPDRRSLAFEHNFLFDFALAKLYLPAENGALVQMIENDPDAVIVLRPSLALRAQGLWAMDRAKFWELALAFSGAAKLSLLAQMTPMITVAENARDIKSLEPLIEALDSSLPGVTQAARRALRHLVGVLRSGRAENKPFVGVGAGPWCVLLERITRVPKPDLAGICQALIEEALQFKARLTPEQFADVGLAARRVLDIAWQSPQRNGQMIIHALRTVSSTFITDPEGSALRIRRVLTPERVREYGYEELYWLAHEVKALIPLDPDLVADIYIASFDWTETDEGTTPMSHSKILPMVSNKRQDFQHARWQLSQDYPKFVERSPLSAARAMVAVVSAYCREKVIENQKWRKEFRKLIESDHPVDGTAEAMLDDDTRVLTIRSIDLILDGVEARLKEDRSGIWEGGASSNDEAIQILGTFFQHLDGLASNGATQGEAREIIRFVVRKNQQAIVWRRLLSLLAKHPVLAQQFKGLADAKPLMLASETQEQFGQFIAALYPHLSVEERGALEQSILAIANEGEADQRQARQHLSDSLLGALGDVELTTDAARTRLASVKASAAANAQREPATLGFGQMTPEDIERMHRHGESPEERSVRKRIAPTTKKVEQFGMQHINKVPSLGRGEVDTRSDGRPGCTSREYGRSIPAWKSERLRCREPCGLLARRLRKYRLSIAKRLLES